MTATRSKKATKTLTILVSENEHRMIKIKAASHDVTISDVCRMALTDDAIWEKAAELKKQNQDKEVDA